MKIKDNYRLSSYIWVMDTENSKTGAVPSQVSKIEHGLSVTGQKRTLREKPGHIANADHAPEQAEVEQAEVEHIEPTADIETETHKVETRSAKRRRVLKTGKIEINLDYADIPCLVHDISDTGAKIKVTSENLVPDNFTLHIPMDGFAVDCHVIQRNAKSFGVEFVGDKRKLAKKKVQYIRAISDWATYISSKNYAESGCPQGQAAPVKQVEPAKPVASSMPKANKPSFGRRGS